jgi:hypothetical protein
MRFRVPILLAALSLFGVMSARSQTPAPAPYVGQQTREIKALSAEDIQALLKGEGMGLAKVAELNRYPGPSHVLQLAGELTLSDSQRGDVQRVFDRMKARALPLGERIVALERELDRAFAERSVDAPALERRVAEIARLQGELRTVHLRAHLETLPLLNEHQAHRYAQLRGYNGGSSAAPAGGQGQPHGMKH